MVDQLSHNNYRRTRRHTGLRCQNQYRRIALIHSRIPRFDLPIPPRSLIVTRGIHVIVSVFLVACDEYGSVASCGVFLTCDYSCFVFIGLDKDSLPVPHHNQLHPRDIPHVIAWRTISKVSDSPTSSAGWRLLHSYLCYKHHRTVTR